MESVAVRLQAHGGIPDRPSLGPDSDKEPMECRIEVWLLTPDTGKRQMCMWCESKCLDPLDALCLGAMFAMEQRQYAEWDMLDVTIPALAFHQTYPLSWLAWSKTRDPKGT
jgi:hypothetical protein